MLVSISPRRQLRWSLSPRISARGVSGEHVTWSRPFSNLLKGSCLLIVSGAIVIGFKSSDVIILIM